MTRAVVGQRIIGFDLDGVIIDHTANKIILAKRRGWDLKPAQTPSDIIKTILPSLVWDETKKDLYDNPDFALSASLMPQAGEGLNLLKKRRLPCFLISCRWIPDLAIKFLRGHRLWPAVFYPQNSFFVGKKEEKNKIARRLNLTHYVDDEVLVLEKLTAVRFRFLFDLHQVRRPRSPFPQFSNWPALMQKLIAPVD